MNPRGYLLESFAVAVKAADPAHIVPQHLPSPPAGRTLVVGAGKAAAAMTQAVENAWPADAQLDGLVVTRYGHTLPTHKIRIIEAGHPIPDDHGAQAAQEILSMVQALSADDLLLCLLSGGGSSLLSLPIEGISLPDLREITRQLLRCGASIQEINTVRKHLSAIQGGRLATVCKAPVLALIISDVTGDAATHIASGPCAPDPTTFTDALAVLERYDLNAPPAVKEVLLTGKAGAANETPKPGSVIFARVENRIIANAHQSLAAAAEYFKNLGITPLILGDTVSGESREIAKSYAAFAKEIRHYPQGLKAPVVLLSGGETTVTVKGKGRGGRNAEFLLSLLIELASTEAIYALACDTDGLDGSENNAGAFIAPDSLHRAERLGLDAGVYLANNDAYTFFQQLNDLVITGPTFTNVNDYRAILIL
ncbi:glycerate kinase type-2 family protein [Nitrosomonas oligotropha]|uniref:glycerate kinase type-2 family protein n=1 Tax=Nitrosomonas oligotropha TaxID=42354 RepID=UPI00136F3652|nr:glycerate kinase [Nitrosomonas oligotropha]MXS82830.1 glycerate kinase [Nitrosomonas oligotropha]